MSQSLESYLELFCNVFDPSSGQDVPDPSRHSSTAFIGPITIPMNMLYPIIGACRLAIKHLSEEGSIRQYFGYYSGVMLCSAALIQFKDELPELWEKCPDKYRIQCLDLSPEKVNSELHRYKFN